MGLDTTHGAFHGAYSAFNRFRQAVCKAMGGSFPPHDNQSGGNVLDPLMWYWGEDYGDDTHPGLRALLVHSDCEGEIAPEVCSKIADELEALLPKIVEVTQGSNGGGHIERDGGFLAVTQRFINGCREAAEAGESLEFR